MHDRTSAVYISLSFENWKPADGLYGNSVAFKQNDGFPDHPIPLCTPDSKKVLLITCYSPSTGVGTSGGTEEWRGLTGGGQG